MRQDRAEQPQQPQLGREAEDGVPDAAGQAAVEEVPPAVSGAAGLWGRRAGEEEQEARGQRTAGHPDQPDRKQGARGSEGFRPHVGGQQCCAVDIPAWEPDTQL